MAWKSTKGSGLTWNPKKDADGNERDTATADDFIDGYYVNKKENIGEHNSNVYTIQKEDESEIDVWGDTVVNSEMSKLRIGQFIRLQWLGRKLKKSFDRPGVKINNKNSFHNWEVFVDDEVEPLSINSAHLATPSALTTNPFVQKGATAGKVFQAKEEETDDLPF